MRKLLLIIGILSTVILNVEAKRFDKYYKYPTDNGFISDVDFTSSGDRLVIADGNNIKIYSTVTKELLDEFKGEHNQTILSIDISTDNTMVVSGDKDGIVLLWNLDTGEILDRLKYRGVVTSVAFSPDGSYLAYGGSDRIASVYDIKDREDIFTTSEHGDDITSVAFSMDSNYIATAGGDKLIKISSVKDGLLLTTLSDNRSWIRDIAFSPDSTSLISCGDAAKVISWDIKDITKPKIIETSRGEAFSWILSLDINWNSKVYAIGNSRGDIDIIGLFGSCRANVKYPVTSTALKPNRDETLSIAVATRGNGVLFIEAVDMNSRANENSKKRSKKRAVERSSKVFMKDLS